MSDELAGMIEFRGFAAPFDQPGVTADGVTETIAFGAFSAMVARGPSLPVLFGSHDGPEIAKASVLFETAFGLAFGFSLDLNIRGNRGHLHAIAREVDGASVNFTAYDTDIEDAEQRRIMRAELNHIALVARTDAAY